MGLADLIDKTFDAVTSGDVFDEIEDFFGNAANDVSDFFTSGDALNLLGEGIDLGVDIADGIITHGGTATTTVIEGLVKGGGELGQSSLEVGGNILGAAGEGFGGAFDGLANALGIPTPGQVAGGTMNMLMIGAVILVLVVVMSNRGGGGGSAPPQIVMLPSGQVANIAG